jgi:hypothetical protein
MALTQGGEALSAPMRSFYEPRFARDLGGVRLHGGMYARQYNETLRARAFTVGNHIWLGRHVTAQPSPVLAHDLAHVLQQSQSADGAANARHIQRTPDDSAPAVEPSAPAEGTADPLCASIGSIPEISAANIDEADNRLTTIRKLKIVKRCGTAEQQTNAHEHLKTDLGEAAGDALWLEADAAFAGYTGMYPEYAPDIKRHLKTLGTTNTAAFQDFAIPATVNAANASAYRASARRAAKAEKADLGRTDILYFRGHQYAQYKTPGVFTSVSSTPQGFDLRYVEQAGGFPNVKLMICTSCATLCTEALDLFTGLFPNVVILGYRGGAPLDGDKVRNAFDTKITALKRPLLLDQAVDVDAIVGAWQEFIQARYAGDAVRLPGVFRAGNVEYFDGKAWNNLSPSSADNKCARHGNNTTLFPGP